MIGHDIIAIAVVAEFIAVVVVADVLLVASRRSDSSPGLWGGRGGRAEGGGGPTATGGGGRSCWQSIK